MRNNEGKPMKKWHYYIAWFQDSDGADGEDTLVYSQDDLKPEFDKNNENISRYSFRAPEEYALQIGMSKAFNDNYTVNDTVSLLEEVKEGGLWIIDATAVAKFDTLQKAQDAYETIKNAGFKICDKIDIDLVSVMTEEEFDSL
jgi:hypothetical protein